MSKSELPAPLSLDDEEEITDKLQPYDTIRRLIPHVPHPETTLLNVHDIFVPKAVNIRPIINKSLLITNSICSLVL
jgi:hypothetical protein